MKVTVNNGPGAVSYEIVDDPKLEANDDIILKVTLTAICGSDLHI